VRRFRDRRDAGRALAEALRSHAVGGPGGVVVLGLPRGGVPVAAEVAAALAVPMDVLVVRKLGLPKQPELAMGAIAAVGDVVETVREESVLAAARVDGPTFAAVRARELLELRRREAAYRGGLATVPVHDRVVLLVDDGLATGSTMRAAAAAVRRQGSLRIVAAAPIGSPTARAALAGQVDEVVCVLTPSSFRAVGQAYEDFAPTGDDEVRAALARVRRG
jgi:putative phosphoribosyl transferase